MAVVIKFGSFGHRFGRPEVNKDHRQPASNENDCKHNLDDALQDHQTQSGQMMATHKVDDREPCLAQSDSAFSASFSFIKNIRSWPNPSRSIREAGYDGTHKRCRKDFLQQTGVSELLGSLKSEIADFVLSCIADHVAPGLLPAHNASSGHTPTEFLFSVWIGCEYGKHRSASTVELLARDKQWRKYLAQRVAALPSCSEFEPSLLQENAESPVVDSNGDSIGIDTGENTPNQSTVDGTSRTVTRDDRELCTIPFDVHVSFDVLHRDLGRVGGSNANSRQKHSKRSQKKW